MEKKISNETNVLNMRAKYLFDYALLPKVQKVVPNFLVLALTLIKS